MLRHSATRRKVAGSIPDGVAGIFLRRNPSGCTKALASSQPLTQYQEYFLGGKGGRCVGLTTLPPSYADCLEIWEPQLSGILRAVQACIGITLLFFWPSTLGFLSKVIRAYLVFFVLSTCLVCFTLLTLIILLTFTSEISSLHQL